MGAAGMFAQHMGCLQPACLPSGRGSGSGRVGSRRGAQRGKGFSRLFANRQMPWAARRSPERLDRRRVPRGVGRAVFIRGAGRGTAGAWLLRSTGLLVKDGNG